METISILPNPFKILEQQIAKKESLNDKCKNCDDNDVTSNDVTSNDVTSNDVTSNDVTGNKKEGFNNLNNKKTIIEGAGKADNSISWWWLFMSLGVSIMYYAIRSMYFIDVSLSYDDDNNKFIDNYMSELKKLNSKKFGLYVIMFVLFIGLSFLGAFIALNQDEFNEWWRKPIPIGFIMFILSLSKTIIEFFENTFGYLLISLTGLNLNMYMQSDNFQSSANNNSDTVSINFNPLITLFNLENFAEKFTQIRVDKGDSKSTSTTDFFISRDMETQQPQQFISHLYDYVLKKRVLGESIWLLLTTFFTIGILKGTN